MTSFDVRHGRDATTVSVGGELDAASAGDLRSALAEAAKTESNLLLVDMAQVGFLDSAGLAVLVGFNRALGPDRRVALCNVPPRMQRMLEVAGIGLVLQIHNADEPWPFAEAPPPAP